MSDKVIITCATTGSIHTPTMSANLPVTPTEIAEQSIAAAKAGAAILHLHARDPETGRPTPDPEVFMQFLPQIHSGCDAVMNITTGGSAIMSLDERLEAPLLVQPEMCSLNLGSMNFGLFPMQRRYTNWKHDWEPEFLEGTRDLIFKNTFADIERILQQLGDQFDARFEFECYDTGHIQTPGISVARRPGKKTAVRAIRARRAGRHRRRAGAAHAHEGDGRQAAGSRTTAFRCLPPGVCK